MDTIETLTTQQAMYNLIINSVRRMKSVSRLLLYSSWMKEVLNVLNWNEELFSLSGIRHEINLETSLRGNRLNMERKIRKCLRRFWIRYRLVLSFQAAIKYGGKRCLYGLWYLRHRENSWTKFPLFWHHRRWWKKDSDRSWTGAFKTKNLSLKLRIT